MSIVNISRGTPLSPKYLCVLLACISLTDVGLLSTALCTDSKNKKGTRVQRQRLDSLDEAIAKAKIELNTDHTVGVAAIVYTISTLSGQTIQAHTKFRSAGRSAAGYIPGTISTSEAVMQPAIIRGATRAVELHVIAHGFERCIRRVILHPGELVIWDDIVLEPITNQTAASIVGRVRLEGEKDDLEGLVIYVDNDAAAFTDASGYFAIDSISSGRIQLSTQKTGFLGLRTEVRVAAGEVEVCELTGHRKRFAHVRWAYQPDGTRHFDGETRTGSAVLSTRKMSRISFAKGFQQVSGLSDFLITQEKDQLILRHFDMRGGNIPSSILIKDSSLDDFNMAPDSGYARTETPLHPGDVYFFHCYDGEHYAMMEVLKITTERPPLERD